MRRHGEDGTQRLARAGVTERESEVLAAVAERLRNREIAERLHLSVRTVESHIAALLRKLGVADRAALVEVGVQLRRGARTDARLPAPLTSLVGRDDDVDEVSALVEAHRLVTLIGPAGVGKTRLALRIATLSADRYADGARLADLAPVEPALVGDTLARALGVVPQAGWPLRDVLRDVAAELHCLLVVDNCEHVIAEAAEIVADLLAAGGRLDVLATSREPLAVPGEASYPVPPLPVPAPRAAARAATAANYDAVRLFVDRGATASHGFALTDATAPAVAALCERLDGLPLAIELAAARVRTFGPDELVAHLDKRFELLTAGARTAPPRHRTLRAAVDWSYDQLDDDERALFDRLGVFPADFDFAAARAVGGKEAGVLTLLPRLIDRSLVSTVGGETGRYRLLETIRAYAAERLASGGGESSARLRHADHYLALAEEGGAQLRTSNQRVWLARLVTEQPNLRAAFAHHVAAADPDTAWRWIAALQRYWDVTGQRLEAEQWIRQAQAIGVPPATATTAAGLAAASAILQASQAQSAFDLALDAARLAAGLNPVTRAKASRAVGLGAMWVKPDLVIPALRDALAGFGDDQPWERALTMQSLAQATGDLAEAIDWGQASVALFRTVGDDMYAANALFIMAQRAMMAGLADDEVHRWMGESQALAESTGSEEDLVHATVGFGQLAWLRGEHDEAARLMARALPTLRRLGDQRCTGRAQYVLGQHASERHDLDRAERHLAASIEAILLAGQSFVLVNAIEALAAVYAAQGRPRDAAILLGTAHTAREAALAHMRPVEASDEKLGRSLTRTLGAAAFDAAYADGRGRPPADALRSVR